MEDGVADVVVAAEQMPVLNKEKLNGLNGQSLSFIHGFVQDVSSYLDRYEDAWKKHDRQVQIISWLIEERGFDLRQMPMDQIEELAQKEGCPIHSLSDYPA